MNFYNQVIDKKGLKRILSWFIDNYGATRTAELIENLKFLGFHYATKAGLSLGFDDLRIPPTKKVLLQTAQKQVKTCENNYLRGSITALERYQKLIDIWTTTSENLKEEVIQNFQKTPLNPLYMMAFSGARGNISQVRQLVGMRGLMSDSGGGIIDFPIRSNFREGLSVTEYVISCYGARKGLIDTALRTADSGYLTRRLVDVAHGVIISQIDCGTSTGISVSISEKNILGRVLFETIRVVTGAKGYPIPSLPDSPDLGDAGSHLPVIGQGRGGLDGSGSPNNNSENLLIGRPNSIHKVAYQQSTSLIGCKNQEITNLLASQLISLSKTQKKFLVSSCPSDVLGDMRDSGCSASSNDKKNKIFFQTKRKGRITKGLYSISIRSPLTCESAGFSICQLCYGWNLAQGRLVSIGEAVGILAAQSIGEPGTQLTMRTFHTGGIFSTDIQDKITAPHSGYISLSPNLVIGKGVRAPLPILATNSNQRRFASIPTIFKEVKLGPPIRPNNQESREFSQVKSLIGCKVRNFHGETGFFSFEPLQMKISLSTPAHPSVVGRGSPNNPSGLTIPSPNTSPNKQSISNSNQRLERDGSGPDFTQNDSNGKESIVELPAQSLLFVYPGKFVNKNDLCAEISRLIQPAEEAKPPRCEATEQVSQVKRRAAPTKQETRPNEGEGREGMGRPNNTNNTTTLKNSYLIQAPILLNSGRGRTEENRNGFAKEKPKHSLLSRSITDAKQPASGSKVLLNKGSGHKASNVQKLAPVVGRSNSQVTKNVLSEIQGQLKWGSDFAFTFNSSNELLKQQIWVLSGRPFKVNFVRPVVGHPNRGLDGGPFPLPKRNSLGRAPHPNRVEPTRMGDPSNSYFKNPSSGDSAENVLGVLGLMGGPSHPLTNSNQFRYAVRAPYQRPNSFTMKVRKAVRPSFLPFKEVKLLLGPPSLPPNNNVAVLNPLRLSSIFKYQKGDLFRPLQIKWPDCRMGGSTFHSKHPKMKVRGVHHQGRDHKHRADFSTAFEIGDEIIFVLKEQKTLHSPPTRDGKGVLTNTNQNILVIGNPKLDAGKGKVLGPPSHSLPAEFKVEPECPVYQLGDFIRTGDSINLPVPHQNLDILCTEGRDCREGNVRPMGCPSPQLEGTSKTALRFEYTSQIVRVRKRALFIRARCEATRLEGPSKLSGNFEGYQNSLEMGWGGLTQETSFVLRRAQSHLFSGSKEMFVREGVREGGPNTPNKSILKKEPMAGMGQLASFLRPVQPREILLQLLRPEEQSKTGDIVQGLPKIEQLFENRGAAITGANKSKRPNLEQIKTKSAEYSRNSSSFIPGDSFVGAKEIGKGRLGPMRSNPNNGGVETAGEQLVLIRLNLQRTLVSEIQSVYQSQGVEIADKHIEIIVRQMTSKVRILEKGKTPFFPDDIVDLDSLKIVERRLVAFNSARTIKLDSLVASDDSYGKGALTPMKGPLGWPIKTTLLDRMRSNPAYQDAKQPALTSLSWSLPSSGRYNLLKKKSLLEGGPNRLTNKSSYGKQTKAQQLESLLSRPTQVLGEVIPPYQPIILGITKIAFLTDSFISAASFQETKRVLMNSALQNRIDSLSGLKENVILGRLIPAGTGL